MSRRTSSHVFLTVLISVIAVAAARTSAQSTWPGADTYTGADKDAANWVLPARDYSGNRYVSETEITPANVGRLKKAWIGQRRRARSAGDRADRLERHDVRHLVAQRRLRARREDGRDEVAFSVQAARHRVLGQPRHRAGQRQGLRSDARRPSHRARRDDRQTGVERRRRARPDEHVLHDAARAVQEHAPAGRLQRRLGRDRLHQRVRRRHRQADLGLEHDPRPRPTGSRRPGAATRGSAAAARFGAASRSTRPPTRSMRTRATRSPTSSAPSARARTSTPTRWSRSTSAAQSPK